MPAAKLGLLCAEDFIDIPAYPARLGATAVHLPCGLVTENYIRSCHAAGLAVHAWTTDVKLQMLQLSDWGIDAFITDCPDSGCRVVDGDRSWLKEKMEAL